MRVMTPLAGPPATGVAVRRLRFGRLLIPIAVLAAYLLWPYVTLWRLDRALIAEDREALASLVDLDAVRGEILGKLNKESESAIGPMSDAFIDWLEKAIRRHGAAALERQVTLDWVRERMLAHSSPGVGLTPALTHAFFDDPLHFSLRIGAMSHTPVYARLTFRGIGWRITALYF